MWLEECESFAELCRGYLPYYLLIVLPIFIAVSPVSPVIASHEIPVHRMHQYDLHGIPHGIAFVYFRTFNFNCHLFSPFYYLIIKSLSRVIDLYFII